MRHAVALFLLMASAWAALLAGSGQHVAEQSPDEAVLRAAGLDTDGDALLEFFRQRTQPQADLDKLLVLARQLGDTNAQIRAGAAAKLVATGPWAGPALRHVINELDNPLAAQEARRCLEWIEGPRSREVPIAAAKLLVARKPAAAATPLLEFVPVADDQTVVDAVKAALAIIAAQPGKTDAALLAALQDPLPLRRAIAVEILAGSGHAEHLSDVRMLLADAMPQVRLRAALALTQRSDEAAVGVLIDLLVELPSSERLLAEKALQQLAGDWSPAPALQGDDTLSRKIRREAWAGWWRTMDGPALVAALRQGAAKQSGDKEKLPSALPRLLAVRKPVGATEALFAYLPFADDRSMKDEIGKALTILAMVDGKPDPAVILALTDPLPARRIAAAAALAGAGGPSHPIVRKLLTDGGPEVRLGVVTALVQAHNKEAVPALIDLIAQLPRSQTSEAEELLRRLAGARAPLVPAGDDAAARKMLRDLWQGWWKEHGAAVNMAQLEAPSPQKTTSGPGFRVVAEIVNRGPKGKQLAKQAFGASERLVALDRNGKTLWQIENLAHPNDFQILPGERVLISEFDANRVTVRDFKGKILWEATNLPGAPVNVQRLSNGNTFVALYTAGGGLLVELNPAGKTVATFNLGLAAAAQRDGMMIAAFKMADGKMIYVTEGDQCVWLDAAAKEIKRFAVAVANANKLKLAAVGVPQQFIGNIDVTPKDHVVIAQMNGAIAEYDTEGKVVWQALWSGNRATRLANGNTLVSSLIQGVAELDSAGKTVWEYNPPPNYRAVRARQVGDWPAVAGPAPIGGVAPAKTGFGGNGK